MFGSVKNFFVSTYSTVGSPRNLRNSMTHKYDICVSLYTAVTGYGQTRLLLLVLALNKGDYAKLVVFKVLLISLFRVKMAAVYLKMGTCKTTDDG